ncbi:MAG: hypothetical protein ACRCU2_02305 [Planktothrix sp.]
MVIYRIALKRNNGATTAQQRRNNGATMGFTKDRISQLLTIVKANIEGICISFNKFVGRCDRFEFCK